MHVDPIYRKDRGMGLDDKCASSISNISNVITRGKIFSVEAIVLAETFRKVLSHAKSTLSV